jgi:sporulation protein YlmC with PRC-barrel domain
MLHSMNDLKGLDILATDGEIGHIEDLILDDDSWAIRYLVIDTHNWLPGKKVLVSPRCITATDWTRGKVHINLSREGVKRSPEYDSSKLVDQYFDQPYFWLN